MQKVFPFSESGRSILQSNRDGPVLGTEADKASTRQTAHFEERNLIICGPQTHRPDCLRIGHDDGNTILSMKSLHSPSKAYGRTFLRATEDHHLTAAPNMRPSPDAGN
jgi:hypothetical protein